MEGSVERDGETWTRCLEIVEVHERVLLEVGLDFRGVIGNGLRDHDFSSQPISGKRMGDGDKPLGLGLR